MAPKMMAKEKIMLAEYLPGLLAPVAASRKGGAAELTVDCPDAGVAVVMKRPHLDIIMKNLVENALTFNDRDPARIAVKVRKDAWNVEISVSDNGRGIPPEDREKVFEGNYQVERYFTGNVEGAGLGLAIVKRLAAVYGGQVRLASELGAGSTFTVTFPVK